MRVKKLLASHRNLSILAAYIALIVHLCTAYTILLVCLTAFDQILNAIGLGILARLMFVIGFLTIQGLLAIILIKVLGIIKVNRNTYADAQTKKEENHETCQTGL